MRKIFLAVLALLCLLTACSKTEEPQDAPRENVGQITYVGVCIAGDENPAYRQPLEKALLRMGYYVNFVAATEDQSLQNTQIDQFIAEQYDILIVEPVMVSAVDVILQKMQTAQTPVVLLGEQPDAAVLSLWSQSSFVGFEYKSAALLQGQIVRNVPNSGDVNGDGQVAYAILTGPEDHAQTPVHTENCIAALTESGVDLQLLDNACGEDSQESGKALTEKLLSQFGRDIEVLFCASDRMALGALEALNKSGRTVNQDVYLVGIGGDEQILSMVSQGTLTGTAMADPSALASQAAEATAALLNNNAQQVYLLEYTLKETP